MSRPPGAAKLSLAATTALAALAALAGCALGPNYEGPPKEESAAPVKYKNASSSGKWKVAEPSDAKAGGRWWSIFHDSTLESLVDQAMANNQDLRLAAARIEEARAQSRVAAADFYPQISLEPSGMRQRSTNTGQIQKAQLVGDNPLGGGAAAAPAAPGAAPAPAMQSTSPTVLSTQPLSTTFNLFRAPLAASWELDLFGRVRRTYEAQRATTEAIQADYHNMQLSVTTNVAVAYFSLRALDAEAAVLQRTIATRRDALQLANERLQAGLTNELDVTRAQTDLATNEASVYALRRTRNQVENSLATLLGMPASDLRMAARPLKSDDLPPRVPAGLPSELLERRPDVAAAERQLAAANARIGIATAAFFPRISLSGAAGYESADFGQLFDWQSRIWQLGGSAIEPIFAGGRNVANLQGARARYAESVAVYRGQVLRAFQEVEDALSDLRELAGQAEAQDRAASAARRAFELSQQQYDKGSTAFLDVLDAERTLLANERVSTQLLGQRLQATVNLVKALGGTWH